SHLDSEIEQNGDITYVYLFSAVAFLILLIACINFINLSTARSSTRAKEIGLRKVIGAFRGNLIRQFVTESVVLAVFALVLAVSMVELLLPWFNNFFGKALRLDYLSDPWTLPGLLGLAVIAGLVAGSYPALYLSSFEPVAILRGRLFSGEKGSFLRSGLVVVQFSISVTLIAGVMMLQDQLRFMKNKPLGFNRENLVILPSNDDIYNRFESLKGQWLTQPGITDVTLASRVPSGRLLDSQGAKAEIGGEMKTVDFRIADVHVSHDYLSTLEVNMAAGRDFDVRLASDSLQSFILNESAVKAIGWENAESAIGKKMNYGDRTGVVVGVTEDFHFENLRQTIAPVIFMITDGRAGNIVFRIQEGTQAQALDYLEKQWAFLREGFPFTYEYVDESFNRQYETEDRLSKLIGYFSLLAIVIAALGLFGLALFTTGQRSKEIGIRKVLGASVAQIIVMLTGKFSRLVVVGIVAGGFVAYILAKTFWLKNFAYQGDIRWSTFVLAGLIAIITAWATVAWQSFRAATANPVDAIRQE
ncbi:MAG: FtsX-like permease family protein, partial [Bacteroidia bacterium]